MVYVSLTVRLTSRTEKKFGHSDPIILCGMIIAQRIKGTPGITGWSCLFTQIFGGVWHLDVGSSHPGGEQATKG